jgi:hypothetical protein
MNKNKQRVRLASLKNKTANVTQEPFYRTTDSNPNGTGWGVPELGNKKAGGERATVNPFQIPRSGGYSTTSMVFPNNYFRVWDLTSWRNACDNAIKFGYGIDYAVLTSWVFESSPFVQFLYRKIESEIGKTPFLIIDSMGKEIPLWTEELCSKAWQKQLRQEIALSHFPGYSVLNFDPINNKVYKYPMQNVDPVNEMLKSGTFDLFEGAIIAEKDDLLFVQPSKNYEKFLGWMQPISREFIMMNNAYNYWLAAGKRNGYPLLAFGYPEQAAAGDGNGNIINTGKNQAEALAAGIDPTKGITRPFTFDDKGERQYLIDIAAIDTGNRGDQHKVFMEFIEKKQNEIMQMILLGTLGASTQKNGNKALGEVHERAWETVALDMIEFVETYLNSSYLPKISKWYENFPKNIKFKADKTKNMVLEDIKMLSDIMQENGKKLTDEFFEANGIPTNYFTDLNATEQNV